MRLQPVWCIPVHLVLSVAAAMAVHHYVEEPLRKLLRPRARLGGSFRCVPPLPVCHLTPRGSLQMTRSLQRYKRCPSRTAKVQFTPNHCLHVSLKGEAARTRAGFQTLNWRSNPQLCCLVCGNPWKPLS
jgi:hypothetical protein